LVGQAFLPELRSIYIHQHTQLTPARELNYTALGLAGVPRSSPLQHNKKRLDSELAASHRLDAVPAHLLEMAGDTDAAVKHYRAAAGRTASDAERRYLLTRAARGNDHAGQRPRASSPLFLSAGYSEDIEGGV
ncbi:MAG TPA: hypothetical protein VF062_02950, partial [Candidatus Limnocylindrales bacterium]